MTGFGPGLDLRSGPLTSWTWTYNSGPGPPISGPGPGHLGSGPDQTWVCQVQDQTLDSLAFPPSFPPGTCIIVFTGTSCHALSHPILPDKSAPLPCQFRTSINVLPCPALLAISTPPSPFPPSVPSYPSLFFILFPSLLLHDIHLLQVCTSSIFCFQSLLVSLA